MPVPVVEAQRQRNLGVAKEYDPERRVEFRVIFERHGWDKAAAKNILSWASLVYGSFEVGSPTRFFTTAEWENPDGSTMRVTVSPDTEVVTCEKWRRYPDEAGLAPSLVKSGSVTAHKVITGGEEIVFSHTDGDEMRLTKDSLWLPAPTD